MFAMPEVKIAALVMNYDRSTVCGSSTLYSVFLRPEMWVYWSSHGRHGVRRVGALVREIARRITTPCTTESV